MSYKINWTYNWYRTPEDEFIIKTFYINNIPFTFDEISETDQTDPDIILQASRELLMTPEIFFQKSYYLMLEECHPMLFELDIENPEILDEIM